MRKRLLPLAVLFAVLFNCTGCGKIISDFPGALSSGDIVSESSVPEGPPLPGEPLAAGELYGSYLTMYIGHTPPEARGVPFMRVMRSYADIEDYYNATESEHIYARFFTLAMASFKDEYFEERDVLILVLNEPSSYINHTAEPIEIYPDRVKFKITRHTPESSPLLDTEYHLIFTAPKGSFDGIDDLPIELDIDEVVDTENNSAFDSDPFRLYRPEVTSFCYRADSLTDDPEIAVDAIDGYDKLVYFYDEYKDKFDLDYEFRDMVGTLYNWEICERYILIATVIPCKGRAKPEIADVFVDDLKIYETLRADTPSEGEEPDACWLVLCCIERSDLTGADLNVIYLSVEDSGAAS